jgi:hypothetical protein
MVFPALLTLMRTPRLPAVDWTDSPADLNGLVRFAERGNLVSARVASHFNWPLTDTFGNYVSVTGSDKNVVRNSPNNIFFRLHYGKHQRYICPLNCLPRFEDVQRTDGSVSRTIYYGSSCKLGSIARCSWPIPGIFCGGRRLEPRRGIVSVAKTEIPVNVR